MLNFFLIYMFIKFLSSFTSFRKNKIFLIFCRVKKKKILIKLFWIWASDYSTNCKLKDEDDSGEEDWDEDNCEKEDCIDDNCLYVIDY